MNIESNQLIGILKKNGIKLSIASIIKKYNENKLKQIMNKFTLRVKNPITTYYIITKLYKIYKKKYIIIPRFGGFHLLKNGTIDNIINKITNNINLDLTYIGQLNSNQIIIENYLLNNIYNYDNKTNGNSGCIIKLAPGHGKSYLALSLIGKLKKKH